MEISTRLYRKLVCARARSPFKLYYGRVCVSVHTMRRAICARKWGLCIVSHLTGTDVVAQQFGWVHTLWSRDVVDVFG